MRCDAMLREVTMLQNMQVEIEKEGEESKEMSAQTGRDPCLQASQGRKRRMKRYVTYRLPF